MLEVGAGFGQFSALVQKLPEVEVLHCVEPDTASLAVLRNLEGIVCHGGTAQELPAGIQPNAIVSINVLEHIEDDEAELRTYAKLLSASGGHFCMFAPAGPGLFAPIDRKFGHWRRYSRSGLIEKLKKAGFDVVYARYFNFPGFFLWWLEFCVIKQARFNPRKVRIFDRFFFPIIHAIEQKVIRPPLGQSVLVVARVGSAE